MDCAFHAAAAHRWFCLAAVVSSAEGEQIIGFVVAAAGTLKEFPEVGAISSSSSSSLL
jgi:hypothetical protein